MTITALMGLKGYSNQISKRDYSLFNDYLRALKFLSENGAIHFYYTYIIAFYMYS